MVRPDLGFTKSLEPREREVGQPKATQPNKDGLLLPLSTELSKSKKQGFQESFLGWNWGHIGLKKKKKLVLLSPPFFPEIKQIKREI